MNIFIAVLLSIFGFVILLKYKQFGDDKTKLLDQKLNSVNNALDGCEKMIDELNKLSDYIISNVEEKSVEIKGLINKADEKISLINEQSKPRFEARIEPNTIQTVEEAEDNSIVKLSGHFKKTAIEHHKKEKTVSETKSILTHTAATNAYKAHSELINPPKEDESAKYIVDTVVIDDKEHGKDKGKMFAFVVSSKAKDVIELSKQGFDTTEIAKRLGIGKGEIELILGIKK